MLIHVANYFILERSRKCLVEGAMRQYHMPRKSIEVRQSVLKIPKPRVVLPKCYASNINEVSRQTSNYLKLGWKKCLTFQSPVVPTKEEDCFNQPLFRVTISENLNRSIHYYG